MRARAVRAWLVLLVVAAACGLARLARGQLLSPGPLSKAHASLEGDQRCNDCHSSGKRVSQAGCLNCHADVGATLSAGRGLHGLQYRGRPCEGCHVEHLGGGAPVRWPGGDPSKLDHALTGWLLEGAHRQTACNKCHARANGRGAHTYLGLATACASCHKDVHQNRFGSACAQCHGERTWQTPKLDAFDHDLARFPLRGAHRGTACAKCHSDPPTYSGLRFAACTDCHKDVHRGRLGPTCTNCHDEAKWRPAALKPGTHPGTSLANGHARVPCGACHDRGNLAPPSKGVACVSCHAPVHRAAFGRQCATCHGSIEWLGLPRSVGLGAHDQTRYPLTGEHVAVECKNCHRPALPRDVRYRGLAFGRCGECHEDRHDGEFAKRGRGECGACHRTSGFRVTTFGVATHASTRFPLEGMHTASPCTACHRKERPMLDLRVAKQACADCHENPHGEQFAREMGQGGCGHCHKPTGWHLPKIDHRIWPLSGAHATAECDSCHHPTDADRRLGHGSSYRGIPRNCGGCHDDVHLGQFRQTAPSLECDRCHTTTAFAIPSFDHETKAHWALTGAHARTTCAKCHTTTILANGQKTPRWRLPNAECGTCHANPHRRGGAQ
jgi:hypothetical protein